MSGLFPHHNQIRPADSPRILNELSRRSRFRYGGSGIAVFGINPCCKDLVRKALC